MTIKRLIKNTVIVNILIILLVVVFFYLMWKRLESISQVNKFVNKIEYCFKKLECIKYKITDEYLSNPDLFQTLKIVNFQNDIGKVKFDFLISNQKIGKAKFLNKNQEIHKNIDSLKNILNNQINNLNIYLSLIEKRGSELTNGVVAMLVLDGNKLEGETKNDISIYKIRILEGKSIYGAMPLNISSITNTLKQLNISNNIMESYLSNLQELNIINKQIGWNNVEENSIIYNFNKNQQKANKLLIVLKSRSDELINREVKFIAYLSMIIILIFFFLYYYIFVKLFNKWFVRPVNILLNLSNNLNNGIFETNDNKIPITEFEKIKNNFNKIINYQKNRYEFIRALNNNIFDKELIISSKNDFLDKELNKLRDIIKSSYEEKIKYDEENKTKQYINEGVAKFSEIAHTNFGNFSKLTDTYIKELVKYLNVIQGGIYLIDDNNKDQLNLISAFAYDRKKFLNKTYKMGEGLVGTCAIEKKILIIDNVPESYIKITSGLGDTPPRHLFIIPMLHNDELIGVIELASLHKLKEYEIDFAQQASGILAVSIANEKINEKTKQLLAQTQEQAIKMKEQEEEMRQNLEELQASQEEFSRREENLKGVLNALNQSWLIAELDNKGVILNMNLNFLVTLGKQLEEVIGKKYQEIINGENSAIIDNKFIDEVLSGKQLEHIEILKFGKKQSRLYLKFSPVYNNMELPIKIICSGYEVVLS